MELPVEESHETSVVVRFLDHYQEFGSYGHLWAAQTFQEAIQKTDNLAQRKILAVKVYTEFAAAIEDLGALCIAIRHRENDYGLIDAYLTYGQRNNRAPSTTLPQIFNLMQAGDGLVTALRLPELNVILANNPEHHNRLLTQLYHEENRLLAMVSSVYLAENSAYIRAFNKTKHGFAVIDDPNLFGNNHLKAEINKTWIVADNPDFRPDDASQVSPIELYEVKLDDVGPMVERIGTIRGAVVGLCRLVTDLLEHNLITATFHEK